DSPQPARERSDRSNAKWLTRRRTSGVKTRVTCRSARGSRAERERPFSLAVSRSTARLTARRAARTTSFIARFATSTAKRRAEGFTVHLRGHHIMPDDTQDQQQQQSQGLWPQTIGDPNVDNSEPAAQQEPSPIEKQLAEMREMFERQQQEWQQREERYQQQFDMLLQRSFTPTQAQPPQSAPEVPSLDDLPDPIQNPTQFSRELAQRIQAREQAIAESVQQSVLGQMTRATALDSMW